MSAIVNVNTIVTNVNAVMWCGMCAGNAVACPNSSEPIGRDIIEI